MSAQSDDSPQGLIMPEDRAPDTPEFPEEIPLLPLRDIVVFPFMVIPILVIRDTSVGALQAAMVNDRHIFLVLQKNPEVDLPGMDDIFPVGVVGRILQVLKLPNGTAKVLIEGLSRATVESMSKAEDHYRVRVSPLNRLPEKTQRFKALVRSLMHSFSGYVKLSRNIPDEVLMNMPPVAEPQRLADTISAHLSIRQEDRQRVLEASTLNEQISLLLAILAEETELLELEQSIDREVKERLQKSQKDFYLHEQMRVIKEELGEDDETDSEVRELGARIKKSGMPAEAAQKAMEELNKLPKMHIMSPESTVIRNYLEWLLSLPWKKRTKDTLDIRAAKAILDEDHFSLDKPKERILEYLAVLKLAKKIRGPILCFTGPPGTGKTSLGKSVAHALGRKFVRVSLGGVRDEAEIRGHRRTYIGALPGRIIQSMKRAGTRNPVFLLDEIDKIGMDFRGDPSSALLEVLDPEQNNTFSDHFLEVDFDLSEVMFITTANFEDNIPAPLMDRMEIIRLSGYLEHEKVGIAEKHLIPKQMEACGLTDEHIAFERESILKIINSYTAEAGVRSLERSIAGICRKVAREVVTAGKRKAVKQRVITVRNLQKYLGIPKVHEKRVAKADQAGMAIGLAWTPVGGEILYIETSLMPGKGELILTGHLGDVMKESARAALTYAKSNMAALGIPEGAFENRDVHIHVPEGAIPKDGPSAGVSIITSLVSAVSGVPVSRTVGMTGEITLRGNVLPIGGLKEKLLAAKRSGIKKVIVPRKNEADLKEMSEEITNDLTLVFAEHIEEVIREALVS